MLQQLVKNKNVYVTFRWVALLSLFSTCKVIQSQSNPTFAMNTQDTLQNRAPAVAGSFYPSSRDELQQTLSQFFAKAPARQKDHEVRAIISPHAGYVFSGEVAAAAFSQVDPNKIYKTVFIIGSSHRNAFGGASVYSIGNFVTPLGTADTDLENARKLVAENKILAFDPQYHRAEHSIEVQIPFLQYWLKKDFKIVAILLGSQDSVTCSKIAEALEPYFTHDNLFVISTDFSHYPGYDDAVKTDKQIADAIVSNDPRKFMLSVENCTKNHTVNLATGCCSWPSVITLMYLTEKKPGLSYKQVLYKNSGDSEYGEKDRVVGYYALSIEQHDIPLLTFTEKEKQQLLQLARNTISVYLEKHHIPDIDTDTLPTVLKSKAGAFVTLKKNSDLRGCIGHFEADKPLFSMVQQMAVAASTQDYRFAAVSLPEMDSIDIEISVLTPLQKITDVNKIRLGMDGVYIRKGGRSGTFLPQVATDTGWNLEEFLGYCARDKAGIGWDGWKDKDCEIYVYQAIVFGEKE